MRIETIIRTLYTFEELSELAKQNAISNLSNINVDDDKWWDSVYEDANMVGITIDSFDLDRNRHAKTTICNPEETAKLIIENHGEHCETYKTAKVFMDQYKPLKEKNDRIDCIFDKFPGKQRHILDNLAQSLQDDMGQLTDDFKKSITEDYFIMLQKEYEYLQSQEAIKETIEASEYEFTEDGKLA